MCTRYWRSLFKNQIIILYFLLRLVWNFIILFFSLLRKIFLAQLIKFWFLICIYFLLLKLSKNCLFLFFLKLIFLILNYLLLLNSVECWLYCFWGLLLFIKQIEFNRNIYKFNILVSCSYLLSILFNILKISWWTLFRFILILKLVKWVLLFRIKR